MTSSVERYPNSGKPLHGRQQRGEGSSREGQAPSGGVAPDCEMTVMFMGPLLQGFCGQDAGGFQSRQQCREKCRQQPDRQGSNHRAQAQMDRGGSSRQVQSIDCSGNCLEGQTGQSSPQRNTHERSRRTQHERFTQKKAEHLAARGSQGA